MRVYFKWCKSSKTTLVDGILNFTLFRFFTFRMQNSRKYEGDWWMDFGNVFVLQQVF